MSTLLAEEEKKNQTKRRKQERCLLTAASHLAVARLLLQGKRHKPGVEAAGSPDSARGRGENKAIK